jgi:hypothetical protein
MELYLVPGPTQNWQLSGYLVKRLDKYAQIIYLLPPEFKKNLLALCFFPISKKGYLYTFQITSP